MLRYTYISLLVKNKVMCLSIIFTEFHVQKQLYCYLKMLKTGVFYYYLEQEANSNRYISIVAWNVLRFRKCHASSGKQDRRCNQNRRQISDI